MEMMKIRRILWIVLVISLVASCSGIVIRMGNESKNKSVLLVLDYKDFLRAANEADIDINQVLTDAKKAGVSAAAVRETTLGDLKLIGEVYFSSLGDFLAALLKEQSESARKVRNVLSSAMLNPAGTIVIPGNGSFAMSLKERLAERFSNNDVREFIIDKTTYYYVNSPINAMKDTGLGFDGNVLDSLKTKGFEIVLRPKNPAFHGTGLFEGFEETVRTYGVKYLIFDGEEVLGYPDDLKQTEGIIKRNSIITGIIEAPTQIRYVEQKGLDYLIPSTRFAINRAHIMSERDLQGMTGNAVLFRWMRSVVDRNIRFVYVQPLKNPEYSIANNINAAISAAGSLESFIDIKGFSTGQPLQRLSDKMPVSFHSTAVVLSLVAALLLYLSYMLGERYRLIMAAAFFALLSGPILLLVMRLSLPQLLALSAATIYPSFSSLLIMRLLKSSRERPLMQQIPLALAIMLGINAAGAYTVVTTLADIRFTMNTEIFTGVLFSFAVPLLLFIVNYASCFTNIRSFIDSFKKLMSSKITYAGALLAVLGLAAVILYLARSGNSSGIPVTTLELKVREYLEGLMVVRPRFKEFLIGYPALFSMFFLYRRNKSSVLLLPLGLGVTMGCVSIVNSFCHVFTPVEVSINRTVNGLFAGLLFAILATTIIKIISDIYEKRFLRQKS
ncbi:MAG: DUF5693 family protein [Clostridia bacterium]|nr:DUF5693 family protein [Clostridia bacterium]